MKRITDLEKKYVIEALDNEFRTSLNNTFCARFEQAFCKKFNTEYAIAQVNGTTTMHTALAACGVKAGDEVIVPPLTMSATSIAVLHMGAIPIFADVKMDTFTIDPEDVIRKITPKTKAIIPVSLYGLYFDVDAIMDIAQKNGLYVIADNAQCFLGKYKGKVLDERIHFASFSFQASKHLTCGEGGIITTNNETFADAARRFTCLGYAAVSSKKGKIRFEDIADPCYDRHVSIGWNYRMSEINAACCLGQVERIEELVKVRTSSAELFLSEMKDNDVLFPQAVPDGYENSYWTVAAVLNTKEPEVDWYKFRDNFKNNGGDGIYAAWKLTYMEPLFIDIIQKMDGVWQKYEKGLCPVAEYLQTRMMQFKTNYWDIAEAAKQAEILKKTLNNF